MKTYDLYTFSDSDINLTEAKYLIEQALSIRFALHHSLYLGGDYYQVKVNPSETFLLRQNMDLLDNEPAEIKFPDYNVLLYVEGTERPEEIENLLSSQISNIKLLRRRNL